MRVCLGNTIDSVLYILNSSIIMGCFATMSPDSDDKSKLNTSDEGISKTADAALVLNQLKGNNDSASNASSPENMDEEPVSSSSPAAEDDTPPDNEEIRRKLEEEDADQRIREQLANAKVWEEKQKAIEKERERQRKEIERQIESESRKKSVGKWKRNIGIGAAVILVIIIAAALTFTVQPNLPATHDSFPYVSTYNVRIPQAEPVDFGGIPVTVSGTGDKVIVSISGGLGTEIGVGDSITLSSPKKMVIQIFGVTLFESDYQIVATFRGYVPVTSQNDFAVAVMTTRPVPEWAVGVIMPDGVDVTPISADDL